MKNMQLKELVNSGLMAAIVVVGTLAVRIPTPTKGYIHIGDSMVYLCGILLGPFYGAAAAGLGSFMADILSGYVVYAPATLLIKFLDALIVGLVYFKIAKHQQTMGQGILKYVCAVFLGGSVMVIGYLAFESILYGFPVAILGVIPNIIQAVGGGVLLVPVLLILRKQKIV